MKKIFPFFIGKNGTFLIFLDELFPIGDSAHPIYRKVVGIFEVYSKVPGTFLGDYHFFFYFEKTKKNGDFPFFSINVGEDWNVLWKLLTWGLQIVNPQVK